ncbi:NADH-quinone oxidoreductase subunit N [Venenivibrio stagnispumantis]|uniref:NADH-quinone oxidoreductase subunit N n=1 Tax=Venenivibrio stagnispumantis TaxID=407998 RepID=A0AA45WJ04_9AQUI|nr:NADH-quinone oxidoreductase subunit N [Venenivibrio stagnispumantis]MCW4572527.1 NADH-quinone oxidoreductase subunit N [Venenivibrio stagnispumantis]SMP01795.1 NADH-quinone oxidoreductase subunit N [Venenivibrio stagnispumantis]
MNIIQQVVAGLGVPNFYLLIPEIIVLTTAIIVFVLELFTKNKSLLNFLTIIGLSVAFISIFFIQEGGITLYGLYIVDTFSLAFKLFLIFSTIAILLTMDSYLNAKKTHYGEFYYLITFALLGMMIMVSSPNLVTFYIGLELMSVSLYILIGMWRKDYKSKEGAFKYLVIGGTGTAIISYGIALIYGKTGSFDFSTIAYSIGNQADIATLAGLGILILGLALKASAVPLHFWTPDAYEAAPTPITAFLAGVSKVATYAVLLRVMVEAFPFIGNYWGYAWGILAAASMIVGNSIALRQKSVKRMLAYSSIAHTGYITAAIAAPTMVGFSALIFYSIVYLFMTIGAFILLSALEKNEGWNNTFDDFKGLAKKHPMIALFMLIYMFSMLGIPPTVGFMGKFGVFIALIGSNLWWLAVVLVIMSIISAGYYLKVVSNMYMHEPENTNKYRITIFEGLTVAFFAVLVLFLGIYPTIFWEISNTLSSVLIFNVSLR